MKKRAPATVIPPVKAEDISRIMTIAQELIDAEKIVLNRVRYIIDTIAKVYKTKCSCWYFYGAGEGDYGDMVPSILDATRYGVFSVVIHANKELDYTDSDGEDWSLSDGFPYKWLTQDFEEELVAGRQAWLDKEEQSKKQRKLTKEQNSIKKQEALAAAKAKLSKSELAALGIKR